MKAAEIKALSAEQRTAKLAELKEELFNLHFQQAINQLDNPMRIKALLLQLKTRFVIRFMAKSSTVQLSTKHTMKKILAE